MAKMHGRLLALLLVVTVTATTTAISQNQLATLVNRILRKLNGQTFKELPMFSLAVSIPYNRNLGKYDLNQVHLDENVRDAILHCDVYSNENIVAATVLKWPDVLKNCPNALVPWEDVLQKCKQEPMTWQDVNKKCRWAMKNHRADHAEYRVLKGFQTWSKNKDKSGFLLLYVYASPCTDQCTAVNNERSILNLVKGIKQWKEHAVVFSKVFEPKGSQSTGGNSESVGERKDALIRLGSHLGQNGLQKIFRCDKVKANMVCDSCSNGKSVTRRCYNNSNQQDDNINCPPHGDEGQNRRKRSLGNHSGVYDASDVPSRRVPRIKGVMTSENTDYSDDESSSRVLAPGPPTWGMGRERRLSKRQKGRKGQKGAGREQEGQQENEQGKAQHRKVAKTQGQGKAQRRKVAKTQGQGKAQSRKVAKSQGQGKAQRRKVAKTRGQRKAQSRKVAKTQGQGRAQRRKVAKTRGQGKAQRRKVAKTQGQGKAQRRKVAKTQGQGKAQRWKVAKTQGQGPRGQADRRRGWCGTCNKLGGKHHGHINAAQPSHRSGGSAVTRRRGRGSRGRGSKPSKQGGTSRGRVRSSRKRGASRGRGRSSRVSNLYQLS
ncbi:hornerin-like isoform X2 [Corythoichthys intestinalis]|nr:hornerin-like isoform X2 [Corythoichthys intestinalis]XP_057699858.1 hornerin-like isoform X2 [Corythoichthys intestinalis]